MSKDDNVTINGIKYEPVAEKPGAEHCKRHPKPGDFWHELFVPVLVVLAVDDDHVYYLDDYRNNADGGWSWDESSAKKTTKEEFATMDLLTVSQQPCMVEYFAYKYVKGLIE